MKDLMNYAVSKIRAKEALLIDSNGYLRLSQSRNGNEFIKLLSEYGYGIEKDFDLILSNELLKTYDYVKEACKNDNFLYPFLLKYDLFNIGVYMKSELSGLNIVPDALPFKKYGNFDINELITCLRDNKRGKLPQELIKYFYDAKEIYLNTGDIGASQMYLDKHGYEFILNNIKKTDSEFIKKYYMTEADIKNLTSVLRLKRINSEELIKSVLISGGFAEISKIAKAFGNIAELSEVFKKGLNPKTVDEAMDAFSENKTFSYISGILNENLKNLIEKTRLTPFGADPIIAYVLNKESEIKKLRYLYYNVLAKKQ